MKYAAALSTLLLASVPASAQEDCGLQLIASLPMAWQEGQVVIDAAVAGYPLKLIVDTGGTTLLKEKVANAIGLKAERRQSWQHASIFGGGRIDRHAVASDFRLGTLLLGRVNLLVMADHQDWKADGLLGSNVLRNYDVDFDFGHAKLNLFLPHRCPGRAAYWVRDEAIVAKVPFDLMGSDIRVPVRIEGHAVKAILDTGAAVTVMDQETFFPLFGLTPQSPGLQEYRVAGDPGPRYAYTFEALSFGGVEVKRPRLRFISQRYANNPDYRMLLGSNILRLLHVFIAYREKVLYITAADAH